MGSQQLLLVVLGMVITGIAITVAITMFQSNAIESSRSAMIEDLLYLAGKAREYYCKPLFLGGGNRDFRSITSLRQLSRMTENDNGEYSISEPPTKDELVLRAVGKITVGDDLIEVKMRINEQTSIIEIIH